MGPDTRLSRPTTTFGRAPAPAFAATQAPNADAKPATISGVSPSPTRPRTPDTLTISPSYAILSLAGTLPEAKGCGNAGKRLPALAFHSLPWSAHSLPHHPRKHVP